MHRRRLPAALLAILLTPLLGLTLADDAQDPPSIRFVPFAVFVETGDAPLAAYQVDIHATAGDVKIVGIEGGEHAAFTDPPYYDPAAMRGERVIVAAFSTAAAGALPVGRTRVVTLHVEITGGVEAELEAVVTAVATVEGRAIDATVSIERGNDT